MFLSFGISSLSSKTTPSEGVPIDKAASPLFVLEGGSGTLKGILALPLLDLVTRVGGRGRGGNFPDTLRLAEELPPLQVCLREEEDEGGRGKGKLVRVEGREEE